MTNDSIIQQCQEFLEDSNRRYSESTTLQSDALEFLNDIYQPDIIKTYKLKKRYRLSYNKLQTICDNIVAPAIASPYHINAEVAPEVQQAINSFENALETKMHERQSFARAVQIGTGYLMIGIDEEDKPTVEFITDNNAVAFDASSRKVSGIDAEEAAVVTMISKRKAQRLYPNANLDSWAGIDWKNTRWHKTMNEVAIVNYYWKNESGIVQLSKIVGDQVTTIDLQITTIPLIRFAGYEKFTASRGIDYEGMSQKLHDLTLAENISWSGLIERSGRTVKAKFAMQDSAMQGDVVMNGIKNFEDDSSLILPYHGTTPPTPLTEHCETGDLTAIIESCRTLTQDVSGISLQGIQPTERTAQEIRTQQLNQINSNTTLYSNLEAATRHMATVILEIICGAGNVPKYTLEGGVGVMTDDLENQKLLQDVKALLESENGAQLAYICCKNSKAKNAKDLMQAIKSSNPDTWFPQDENDTLTELAQTRQLADQAIAEATNIAENYDQLKAENEQLNLQLMDMKAQMTEQAREFNINTQLKLMEISNKNGIETAKLEADIQKEAAKAETDAIKADNERAKIIADASKQEVPSSVSITEVTGV